MGECDTLAGGGTQEQPGAARRALESSGEHKESPGRTKKRQYRRAPRQRRAQERTGGPQETTVNPRSPKRAPGEHRQQQESARESRRALDFVLDSQRNEFRLPVRCWKNSFYCRTLAKLRCSCPCEVLETQI